VAVRHALSTHVANARPDAWSQRASVSSYRARRRRVLTCVKVAFGVAVRMRGKSSSSFETQQLPIASDPRRSGAGASMFQIRIHGRGGQGVVSGAEMLSVAAFLEGRHAQAFPSFGSERMGAPVMAFCRIDDKEIRLREPVGEPDALIIQDQTLLHQVDLFNGLPVRGYILINATRSFDELGLGSLVHGAKQYRLCALPATELALKHVGRPVPNAALLGGFAAITGVITLASVVAAIRQKFSASIAEKNVAAATEAFEIASGVKETLDA
jgi:pyruvate ferredoxin oxidoreductase gamma subunit